MNKIDPNKLENELEDRDLRVIRITPVDRVRKGGRTRSWNALVVTGDGHGVVGMGFGKANEISEAIRKGFGDAKKSLIRVPLADAKEGEIMRAEIRVGKVMVPAAYREE